MYLQGNLQAVFDALYALGVIDPLLEKDWKPSFDEFHAYESSVYKAFDKLNSCHGDYKSLLESLKSFDLKTVEYIAMEVAKEFADFYSRKATH
jgi:hypothetical protein